MQRLVTIAIVAALVLLTAAVAAPAGEAKASRDDERAVRAATASFVAALNRGDAKAAAAQWIPDGDLVTSTGQLVKGRGAIEREFESMLGEPGRGKVQLSTVSVRFLGPNVAVEDGTSRMIPAPEGPPTNAYHTIVHVRQGDRWRFAGVRAAVAMPPSNYVYLHELEWLIGRWSHSRSGTGAEGEVQELEGSYRWSDNKNFIIHQFTAELNNQPVLSGTERIAWDPRTQQIRSWLFESDGGVVEGVWSRQGDGWKVEMSGVLGDGTEVSAVHTITRVDDDTFRFESEARLRDGEPEPDVTSVELKRVKRRR